MNIFVRQRFQWRAGLLIASVIVELGISLVPIECQQSGSSWQEEVRKYANQQNWAAAMHIVESQINGAPQDMDVRAWRARVLMWSGKRAEAEGEYQAILVIAPRDPDSWLGLGTIYLQEDRNKEALQALNRAVELDPKRSDIRLALAGALRSGGFPAKAKLECYLAIRLDQRSAGRCATLFVRGAPRHELRVRANNDLFNFADGNADQGLMLISHWTPTWTTEVSGESYHRAGIEAGKFATTLTRQSQRWGALSLGGAAGHDNGVIPKHEMFFNYDKAFRFQGTRFVHGLEVICGQHWYWYEAARILTVNETTVFYLPHDWTWSLGVTEAQSHFTGTSAQWRPSEMTRLGFPITSWEGMHLGGNVLFAMGTENFAQIDQIGEFSSRTYGGGLRLQFTGSQDVTGFAGYQMRSPEHTDLSFGFIYGIRF